MLAINKQQILLGPQYGLGPGVLLQNNYLSNTNLLSEHNSKIPTHVNSTRQQPQGGNQSNGQAFSNSKASNPNITQVRTYQTIQQPVKSDRWMSNGPAIPKPSQTLTQNQAILQNTYNPGPPPHDSSRG